MESSSRATIAVSDIHSPPDLTPQLTCSERDRRNAQSGTSQFVPRRARAGMVLGVGGPPIINAGPRLLVLVPAQEPQMRRRHQLTKRTAMSESLRDERQNAPRGELRASQQLSGHPRRRPAFAQYWPFRASPGYLGVNLKILKIKDLDVAPQVGLEPTTLRLTEGRLDRRGLAIY
jgi:hypothetical protein